VAEAASVRRGASLRRRITVAATAVVLAALLLGAIVFVALLRFALLDGVTASAERHADTLVAQIESGGVAALPAEDNDDEFYQVLSEAGTVVGSSENLEGARSLLRSAGGERSRDADDLGAVRIDDDEASFLTAIDEADVSGGEVTVITGRSTEDVADTLATVIPFVAIALPVLLVLVAATTWVVVGRALRPVERMRQEVDAVTALGLDQRVADPGSDDELGRLARTMNAMLDRLDQSQAAQRRFVSDASHELKSPLASLRQYAEVAQIHPDRISANDLSSAVLDEGARLERIVQNMLVLAHADEHSLAHTSAPVDLDDVLLREASRLRASTTLTIDASAIGAGRVHGDAGLLGQVVRNLADNASRHATSRIALGLRQDAHTIVLTVDDDGDGIPPSQRDRVFERFVRLDDARARQSGGSGLGLSIVREIVRAHGGDVAVTSSALGGAALTVRLPASEDAAS
jgi:signal transduction histidine kinase